MDPTHPTVFSRWLRKAVALRSLGWTMALLVLAGCLPKGDPDQPIPTVLAAAPKPAQRLVVVLPGRADDLSALRTSGMVEAIQGAWPDADVILAELTLAYYMRGEAPQRLHREVIVPARARGYREIWLTGASMGGMGTLMYERMYPGQVDGLVLLAPYVGDRPLLNEIRAAGGLATWEPGPVQEVAAGTWQRELWRHLQTWTGDAARPQQVWLAYGDSDRLRKAMPMLESLLPADQVSVLPGGHTWTMWTRGVREALEGVERKRAGRQPTP